MLYCLNPTCSHPENPDSNRFCHGCGEILANSSREYYFRISYQVVQLLGEGAFGRTYLAQDTDLMGENRVIKRFIAQG
jgi:serine/threonine protein kinase